MKKLRTGKFCPLKNSASALILMLWAVAILSAAVLSLAQFLGTGLDEDAARAKATRADQLAESAVALAMHPAIDKYDPLLHQEFSSQESFSTIIESEAGRINLNFILTDERRDILLYILQEWGLDLLGAESIADSLLDWKDSDDLTRLHGAERDYYAQFNQSQFPRNRNFESFAEVSQVKNMELLEEIHPNWQENFTLWSSGPVNVNEASAEILALITRLPVERVDPLVRSRTGLDGELNTEDDAQITDLSQVQSLLGLSDDEFASIRPLLSIEDPIVRIKVTAKVGNYTKILSVITRKSNQNASIVQVLEE